MVKTGSLILCLLTCLFCNAQDFSNKGKDFWITFPAHVDTTGAVMGIYITSDEAASGIVQFAGNSIAFNITANTVKRVFLGPGGDAPNTDVYLRQVDGVAAGKGIHVTSDKPVVVYAHVIFRARSGASLILPTNVWGKEYLVPGIGSSGQSGINSGAAIITALAKEANTVIEIIPKANTMSGRPAGTAYTVTLPNPGDVYQVQFQKDADISGTIVRSIASGTSMGCKPITVFSASTWSAFDCGATASSGDNLYQQLFPVRAFGKSFITAPFFRRNYDILRVFVTDPATVVTRMENGTSTVLTGLISNSFYEIKTNLPNRITSNKPISVVQYITSQGCYNNNFPADPEMVMLSPTEQTINDITVFSAHQNFVPPNQSYVTECYLNIIIKTSAAPSFKINGTPPSGSFQVIPGSGYSYLQQDVSTISATNPVQVLTADSNFSAIAYGYGNVESYGYNAGTNVQDLSQYILIKNQYATAPSTATCVNAPFQFGVVLPYQPTSLKWLFYGNQPDLTVNNPVADSSFVLDGKTLYRYRLPNVFTYSSSGSFPVSVLAQNPGTDGCNGAQQIDYQLEVYEQPRAYFTLQHSGCISDSVRFTDKSSSAHSIINRWNWSFGDNSTASIANPAKKYNTTGSFTVKETIITAIGCQADTTAIVQITPVPQAAFTTTGPYCSGGKINITDASTIASGSIKYWYWDYGNGKKDTLLSGASPTLIYPGTGQFTITLVVESVSGCRSSAVAKTITVTIGPVADFTPPSVVCLPAGLAKFTNLSSISDGTTAQLKYLWDFGDGSTDNVKDPVHKYQSGGPFTVKLTVTSAGGCITETSKDVTNIFEQPKAAFTAADICLGDTSRFIDQSTAVNQTITKYGWDLGGQVLPVSIKDVDKIYTAAGSYLVKHWVTSDAGCTSDTASTHHLVNPRPVADFSTDAAVCQATAVNFVNQSAAIPALVRWQWDFGDGNMKDVNNGNSFPYTYNDAGAKQVKLVVTSAQGCISNALTKSIQVNVLPVPNFGVPNVCLSDAFAAFTDSSTIADGTQSKFTYLWNFDDPGATASNPNTSTLKNPAHTYITAGNYNVKLEVTSGVGCSASATKVLTVSSVPKADFSIVNTGNICGNATIGITDQSTLTLGNITKTEVYWEWPSTTIVTKDNNPSAGKTYQHVYPQTSASKTYHIRFLAYSGGVCVDEITKDVVIGAVPKVNFLPIPGICLDASPRLITQASEASNMPGSGTYSGPGVSANGLFDPAITGAGTFTIQYLFVTSGGCRDSASNSITVWQRPTAAFSVVAPCANAPASLTDASIANVGTLQQWNWVFGDGTTDSRNNGNTFQKTWTSAGDYTVELSVITSNGCVSDTVAKVITIHPLPQVDFDLPSIACVRTPATFTDRSTIADGTQSQFKYAWDFGGGITSGLQNPAIAFNSTASQLIKLQVTSKDACINSLSKTLTGILPQPMANFEFSPAAVCLGSGMTFKDKSNPLGQGIRSWSWNFGDGSGSTQQHTTHTYTSAASFNVQLSYTSSLGCNSDTITKKALVYPFPVVNAGPDQWVLVGGQKLIPAQVSGSGNYQFSWSPSTWLNNPQVLQPVTSPQKDITYVLTVTGEGGCKNFDDVRVRILQAPVIPNIFSPNGDGINDVWSIRNLENYEGCTVKVFDRYGREVYVTTGYNKPWDGTAHNAPLPVGVYYYIIDPKNGKAPISGSVTILR